MKIKDKLLIFFLLLGVLPLVVLGTFSSLSAKSALKNQADAHFSNTLELISLMVSAKTTALYQAAQSLADDQEIFSMLSVRSSLSELEWLPIEQQLQIRLINARKQNPEIRSIYFISEKWNMIQNGVPTSFESSHFRTAFKETPLYRMLILSANLPMWMTGYEQNYERVYLFRRVQNTITGEILGVMVLAIDEGAFSAIMKQALGSSDGGIFLVNSASQIISSFPTYLRGTDYQPARETLRGGFLERSLPVAQNWTLHMRQSLTSILNGTRYLSPMIILFSIFLAFLSMFVSLVLTEHFSSPIFSLLRAMKRAETGEFEPVQEQRADEFNQLFHGYNAMVDQLSRLFRDLNNSLFEISRHKAEMEEYNIRLEEIVQERTSRLVQSEKMAALGGLVAGVAHEINTPLGIGITSMSFLQETMENLRAQVQGNTLTRGNLENFIEAGNNANSIALANLHRAADLVHSFKRIAVDQSNEELRVFSLRENLEDIIKSLGPRINKSKQQVRINCPSDLHIRSYPGVFYQIITNLILNALIHAWSDAQQEGLISVEAGYAEHYLKLTVSDNGRGMDDSIREMIFEPFFTTKRDAGGTGLGLYIVYNLVEQKLGGHISCESAPGQGASFKMNIPVEQVHIRPEHPI